MRTSCLPISTSCRDGRSASRQCRRTGSGAARDWNSDCLLPPLIRRFPFIRHAPIRRSALRSLRSRRSIRSWRRSVRAIQRRTRFAHSARACADSRTSSAPRASRRRRASSPAFTARIRSTGSRWRSGSRTTSSSNTARARLWACRRVISAIGCSRQSTASERFLPCNQRIAR